MSDFLDAYSIQTWLESCPQGYLVDKEYGHDPGLREPDLVLESPGRPRGGDRDDGAAARRRARRPRRLGRPDEMRARLREQTLPRDPDPRRGPPRRDLHAAPLRPRRQEGRARGRGRASTPTRTWSRSPRSCWRRSTSGDFVAGVVGQNIVLEGLAFSVFEMMQAANVEANPKFAQTLAGTIADERRHVGFGENRIGALDPAASRRRSPRSNACRRRWPTTCSRPSRIASGARRPPCRRRDGWPRRPHARPARQRTHQIWHGTDLNVADPEEIEAVLADTVLKEFKVRLDRIGIEYQTPAPSLTARARVPGARRRSIRRRKRHEGSRIRSLRGRHATSLEGVASPAAPRPRPRRRFVLEDDTGFDEVPKKYRRFYQQVAGRVGRARAQRGAVSRLQDRDPFCTGAPGGRSRLLHALHVATDRGSHGERTPGRRSRTSPREGDPRSDRGGVGGADHA